ncbi:NTP transferase domain-containing protein [Chloroflexota bacterium]
MKAIIVAAGPGSRLMPLTAEKPKCLLEIGGQTMLERTLSVLRNTGIDKIVVVRGYHSEMINFPGITYYQNSDFKNNNILKSLFYAEDEMDEDFVFSYSDIIYSKEIVQKLITSRADVGLITDVNWVQRYQGRDQHPISEAELVKVANGRIVKIGKEEVSPGEAHGEFIGLAKFTREGARAMRAAYHRVKQIQPPAPFHHAASLDKAYLTDMLQELIEIGSVIENIDVEGGWIEIDTPQDLTEAVSLLSGAQSSASAL